MSARIVLAFGLLVSGCLAPREPAAPRYFSPAAPPVARTGDLPADAGPELRLRRVFAADYLRDRMEIGRAHV